MFRLLTRIQEKIARTWFVLTWQRKFRQLGDGAYVVAPFRIDSGDRIELGAGTFIQRGSWLYCGEIDEHVPVLKLGKHCVLGYNNHITCVRSVDIGDFVLTANNVYITDNVHGYEDVSRPIIQQPVIFKSAVSIGSGSWIGENVSIIGVRIGKNCVIGANSVVTCDIPDYCVAVGVPAKVIRQYDLDSRTWVRK